MQSSEKQPEDVVLQDSPVSTNLQGQPPVSTERNIPSLSPLNRDAIRQGLVYPPPPDFYVEMPDSEPSPTPVLPVSSPVIPSAAPVFKEQGVPLRAQTPEKHQDSSRVYAPREGTAGPMRPEIPSAVSSSWRGNYPPSAVYQRRKRSYTWVWVLVSGLTLLILGSCALATWLSYSMFGNQVNNQNDAQSIAQPLITSYYSALQSKDYAGAYTYLHPQGSIRGLTQEQFIQRAQQQDLAEGDVLSFVPGIPFVTNENTLTHFTMAVDIGRTNKKDYTARLTFQQIGQHWYIVDFDTI